MRISDDLLEEWYRLVVAGARSARRSARGEARLARWIVARSHGEEAAREAEAHFTRVVREGRAPEDVPEHTLPAGDPVHLPAVLSEAFGLSTSDVRRLVAQGGLKVEDRVVDALDLPRAELVGTRRPGR